MESGVGGCPSSEPSEEDTAAGRDGPLDRQLGRLPRAAAQRTGHANTLDRPAADIRSGLGLGYFWPRSQNQHQLIYGVTTRAPPWAENSHAFGVEKTGRFP